ncbi:MAG: hypothetical protein CSA53_06610 [Gammaproteobacteria bacterium]|nr:MAG: hypothetical protein CSA53_06610 [Gammaproteobacteria bacterium]
MPSLNCDAFHHTLTYICQHDEHGAMGLVMNVPSGLGVHEVLDHLQYEIHPSCEDGPVLAGGPVNPQAGYVLHRYDGREWVSTQKTHSDVAVTSSKDILDALAQGNGPENYIMALGYAGWATGQLEQELSENCWLTVPADTHILFDLPPDKRLDAAAAKLGIDIDLISTDFGHA